MRPSILHGSVLLLLVCSLFLAAVLAKEVEVTKEWKLLGENDTIPAGMHVRMDMTTGEKWVKQIDEEEDDPPEHMAAAVIHEDGSVRVEEPKEITEQESVKQETKMEDGESFDYEMMHRTLSKLPDSEKERMGGIPELPDSNGSTPLTPKERQEFERRMAKVWKRRQAELKEAEYLLMDLPAVLKERIYAMKEYLKDPISHLNSMSLDEENRKDGFVTHIVSVLEDLEFQLGDVDMARDFHTLGGWPVISSLLSEDVHLPQNKTISKISRRTEAKIRAVQAHAAWAIGTLVKNTEEFFPYAVEVLEVEDETRSSTALDVLIDVFCQEYSDSNSWEVRKMLGKAVYAIGSLLRGNRLAQEYIVNGDSTTRLGEKLRKLLLGQQTSSDTKLVQKLFALASDVVSDVTSRGDKSASEMNKKIIQSFSTSQWCDSVSSVLITDSFIPVPVQETLLKTVEVLAPHCAWGGNSEEHKAAIRRLQANWQENKDGFDTEHLDQLNDLASQTMEALVRHSTGS